MSCPQSQLHDLCYIYQGWAISKGWPSNTTQEIPAPPNGNFRSLSDRWMGQIDNSLYDSITELRLSARTIHRTWATAWPSYIAFFISFWPGIQVRTRPSLLAEATRVSNSLDTTRGTGPCGCGRIKDIVLPFRSEGSVRNELLNSG